MTLLAWAVDEVVVRAVESTPHGMLPQLPFAQTTAGPRAIITRATIATATIVSIHFIHFISILPDAMCRVFIKTDL